MGRGRSCGSPFFWPQDSNKVSILHTTDPVLTGPTPLPAYSSAHIGLPHCWPHLPASMPIHSFLMTSAGPFYSLDLISRFPSKPDVIFNNYNSENKPFRKSKNEDVCFLFLLDFFYCPKEINLNSLSQMFLDNSFYCIRQLFIILFNGFIHSLIGKLCLLSKH